MKNYTFMLMLTLMSCGLHLAPKADSAKDTILNFSGIKCADFLSGELKTMIPDELKYFKASGQPNNITEFGAFVLPVKDSKGLRVDSQCIGPDYVMVVFTNFAYSVLTIYSVDNGEMKKLWQSPELLGRGNIRLTDLNCDGSNEFIVDLETSPHGYQNVYIFTFSENIMTLLNPLRRVETISEFNGFVDMVVSDTGTVIYSYHPTENVKKTYAFRCNAAKIELVAKDLVEKK